MAAYYNVGNLYEDLRQVDAAKGQYEIVAKANPEQTKNNVASAQNNLARLLILEEDYANAIVLLLNGLDNLERTNAGDETQANLKSRPSPRLLSPSPEFYSHRR